MQTSAGTMALVATRSITLTVTGAQILGAAGVLGATYMFAKNVEKMKEGLSSNKYQNQQIDRLQKKYKFNNKIREILHEIISGQGYNYHQIEEIIKTLLNIK